jgi:amino acid transporter
MQTTLRPGAPRTEHRGSAGSLVKRILVGRQVSSSKLEHTLLPKILALPVFSSDPLSSVAYAAEEILIVLVAVSAVAAHGLVMPIAVAIAVVMTIVVISYRQTVRAYPSGGGAYIVSKENLGAVPGLIAAAALLTDYVLTVSVSVAAGVFAISSAFPELNDDRLWMALAFVGLITLANLRGVKESGTLFAVPTYSFVVAIFLMLITGLVRCAASGCPQAPLPEHPVAMGAGALSIFVILRAFSSGSTALTGVEAISNGVPAFRRPQSRNASETLALMGILAISMFVGISFLASQSGVVPSHEQSVVSQIARAVFGDGLLFYVVQATTAGILILAANTAYQDFPRLSSILARDGYLPRQFQNRGDRLVFSNGVLVLAILAGLLLWAFEADVSRLIQLYVVGVFTSFTLSQSGMVVHWLRERQGTWRRSIVINAVGAACTGIVLVVIAASKFAEGAWMVITAMPFIVGFFALVHRHYAAVRRELERGAVRFGDTGTNTIVSVITGFDAAAAEALGYIRSLRPERWEPLYVGRGSREEAQVTWAAMAPEAPPLRFLGDGDPVDEVVTHVGRLDRSPDDFITVVIPELFRKRSLLRALFKPVTARLKFRLLTVPQVVIADVPVLAEDGGPAQDVGGRALVPPRVEALVFVASPHDAAVRAINYARTLNAHQVRAVFLATEPEEAPEVLERWAERGIRVPLDVVEAPFRDLGPPLLDEVRRVTADGDTVAAVILPEFLVTRWWHRILHNNRALFIKRMLLFEPRVILSSVPYQLELSRRGPRDVPAAGHRPPGPLSWPGSASPATRR